MNERIKQIEEQCYIKPGGYYPGSDWPVPFFDKQKFAELIIQKCISQIALIGVNNFENEDIMWTVETAIASIEEHFGVEE
jgi:hypothetical protein